MRRENRAEDLGLADSQEPLETTDGDGEERDEEHGQGVLSSQQSRVEESHAGDHQEDECRRPTKRGGAGVSAIAQEDRPASMATHINIQAMSPRLYNAGVPSAM